MSPKTRKKSKRVNEFACILLGCAPDTFVVARGVLLKNSNDVTNMYIFVHYVLRKRPPRSEVNSRKRELPESVFMAR